MPCGAQRLTAHPLGRGGGGVASTLPRLWGRTRLGPGASARWRLRRLANGVPPAPGVRTSARRAPLCCCRRATGGRGCPACPLGQQCRTPRRLLHRTRIVCVCILWASVRDVQWGTPPRLHLRSASPVPGLSMFHLVDDSHGDLQSRHKPLRLASAHGQEHGVSFGMGSIPPTANSHQPPTTTNRRQPPAATNRQLPTTANRHQPPITNHQRPPTTTNSHQPPVANCQPPTANRQQPPTMVEPMECPRAFLGKLVPEHFFFSVKDRPGLQIPPTPSAPKPHRNPVGSGVSPP